MSIDNSLRKSMAPAVAGARGVTKTRGASATTGRLRSDKTQSVLQGCWALSVSELAFSAQGLVVAVPVTDHVRP